MPVAVERERVHDEGVGEQVEVLARVADRVGPAEPHGAIEGRLIDSASLRRA